MLAKLWLYLSWGQVLLPLTRLVYYSSGKAFWTREAIVPMLRSPIKVRLPTAAPPLALLPQPEYKVRRWTYEPDTFVVEKEKTAATLRQFLEQHIGANVWISYAVGNEWEELQGVIEYLSPKGDVLLRRPSQERVWLPYRSIRSARLEAAAPPPRHILKGWRLSVEIDTSLPAARLAVAGWDSFPPWRAVHILQLTSPTRATLTTHIEICCLEEEASQVELYLIQNESDSSRSFTWHLPLQKLNASTENRLFLLHGEMPYTELYRASLPDFTERGDSVIQNSWRGYAERSIQLLNTAQVSIPAGSVHIFDEQGLPVAQSRLNLTPPTMTGYIPLAHMAGIELRLQEQEIRRERSKNPSTTGPKVTLLGILRIQNSSPREARLLIQKPLTGQPIPEKLGFARSTPLPERRGANPRYLLQWELILRPGATETLEYTYEFMFPPEK
ncbi:MAG: hypothetical protein RMK19_00800 [Bacteroidia bacterium]|nr:DUF4139 domain-containing protein [Bacteroidia bacterium]MDW8014531.1 hypothetical protein [Bacteroidia bacterium]